MMMVEALNSGLPEHHVAEPQVLFGSSIGNDVGTYEGDEEDAISSGPGPGAGGGVAAVWSPPKPSLAVMTDPPTPDEDEVRVYDTRSGRRLVAAVEIVSPANKGRPEHRRAFVTKCAAPLQERVCVAIVDLVTTRAANLYDELLALLGTADPSPSGINPPLYAASCRRARDGNAWLLETRARPLSIGRTLPTLPLWIAENLSVPLDLESSDEATCRVLRIPPG